MHKASPTQGSPAKDARCASRVTRASFRSTIRSTLPIFVAMTCIKYLLLPSYASTDFDVHHFWMQLTTTRAPAFWYVDTSSEWTLDYPPFFAWFEYGLGTIFNIISPTILTPETGTTIPSGSLTSAKSGGARMADFPDVLFFQRSSVIASDLVLYLAITLYCHVHRYDAMKTLVLVLLTCADTGLLLIDHVHFQYNGLLLGLLLLSIAALRTGHHDLLAAGIYASLLMFKHIYLYVALVYFVYLLRHYCHTRVRFVTLAGVVLSIFGLALVSVGNPGLAIIVRRLFPVSRGLVHAYWAPNVWAVYAGLDKALGKFTGARATNSLTRGLVREAQFALLPEVSPGVTGLLAFVCMCPCLLQLWLHAHRKLVLHALVYCMLTAFMLGYHVHEKAILQVTLPLSLLALESRRDAQVYFLSFCITQASFLPLFFTPAEMIWTRVWIPFFGTLMTYAVLHGVLREVLSSRRIRDAHTGFQLTTIQKLYLSGLGLVVFFVWCLDVNEHWTRRWPFLSRLVLSVYCALGMLYVWVLVIKQFQRQVQAVRN